MNQKPISPKEVIVKKQEEFPDVMIEVVNELISKKWDGFHEEIYKKQGWVVEYDQPGWDENYDSFYKFKMKSAKR